MRARVEAVLPADPGSVWFELIRWERQPDWMVDAVEVRVLGRRRHGEGVRLRARTRVLGLPVVTDVLEVTGWDPPHRLDVERAGRIRGRGRWLLHPDTGGTRFVWLEEIMVPIPLLGEMALRLYRPILRALMRRSLANLSARLKASR